MAPRYRIGVDVGGTHTDLVLHDVTTGALLVEKVASTPSNPAAGVLDGIAKQRIQLPRVRGCLQRIRERGKLSGLANASLVTA